MSMFRRRRPPCFVWGIRSSLVSYITGLPDGVVRVDDGAGFVPRVHPPVFSFPLHEYTLGVARYAGTVELSGHGGLLAVTARDPWVHMGERLSVSVRGEQGQRIPVAVFEAAHPGPLEGTASGTLTEAGAAWLGPSYSTGDPVAPITFRLSSRRAG